MIAPCTRGAIAPSVGAGRVSQERLTVVAFFVIASRWRFSSGVAIFLVGMETASLRLARGRLLRSQ